MPPEAFQRGIERLAQLCLAAVDPDPDVDRRHVHHGRRLRNGIASRKVSVSNMRSRVPDFAGRFELFPQVAAFVFFFIEAERCLIGQAFRFVLFASGQRAERRFGPVAFAQPLVTAAQGNGRQPALKGTLPLVGTQALYALTKVS